MSNDEPEGAAVTHLLYGLPGAEVMHDDPAAVYELAEGDFDFGSEWEPFVIEEWSARPLGDDLDSTADVLARMNDDLADDNGCDAFDWERIDRVFLDPEVVAAYEAARTVLASKLSGWKMADEKLRDLRVTWDEEGKPLLDGEPMYVPAATDLAADDEVHVLPAQDPGLNARVDAEAMRDALEAIQSTIEGDFQTGHARLSTIEQAWEIVTEALMAASEDRS